MSIYINHSTNDVSTNAGARVTSGGNTIITTNEVATDAASGIVELATSAEVQTGTDTARVPSVSTLRSGLLVSGTAIATTSGTSHDFTGIPSWAKHIVLILNGVSTNGTSPVIFQIGDSGGIETTGYSCVAQGYSGAAVAAVDFTNGFAATDATQATHTLTGSMILIKQDGNTWVAQGGFFKTTGTGSHSYGGKTLTATLDRVRLTTSGGADTFDAGSFNIMYE